MSEQRGGRLLGCTCCSSAFFAQKRPILSPVWAFCRGKSTCHWSRRIEKVGLQCCRWTTVGVSSVESMLGPAASATFMVQPGVHCSYQTARTAVYSCTFWNFVSGESQQCVVLEGFPADCVVLYCRIGAKLLNRRETREWGNSWAAGILANRGRAFGHHLWKPVTSGAPGLVTYPPPLEHMAMSFPALFL